MARSLAALFCREHRIEHLRDRFGPGVTDIEWIRELNRDGNWIVLSADRRISRNKSEQAVFRSSGLIAFIFAPGLQKATVIWKIERLMAMWTWIEQQAGLVGGGAMFEIQTRGDKLRSL